MLVYSEIIKNAYNKWHDKGFIFEKRDGKFESTTFRLFVLTGKETRFPLLSSVAS